VLCSDFGYEAALPAPTGAGENWGPAPGAPDAFGAAPGFEAATGEHRGDTGGDVWLQRAAFRQQQVSSGAGQGARRDCLQAGW
jgi:deferrochelatase/peroxidase EfeB